MRKSKSKKASKRKPCPDRLSELPDSLILQILSLLETRDVVRTALLSKRWRYLWTTIPCLDFQNDGCKFSDSAAFINFVCRAIALWKGAKLLKFSLQFKFDWSFPCDVLDSWLLFAIDKQVEEIYVSLYNWEREYCAPQRLSLCSSIRKLSIISCKMQLDENVQWNQLKSLTINCINPLSERVMNQILCGAPRLEFLNLQFSDSNEDLSIQSGCLKMLEIVRWPRFERDVGANTAVLRIRAPKLETFEISGLAYARCLLKVPSLTNVSLGFYDRYYRLYSKPGSMVLIKEMLRQDLPSIRHVEKVVLSDWCCKVLLEMKKDMLVLFPNAKFLKLCASAADEILGVLEMFPKVTRLTVERKDLCYHWLPFTHFILHANITLQEPNMVKVDAEPKTTFPSPSMLHLRTIEITWLLHDIDTSIISVIKVMLENAHLLEKMVFWPRSRSVIDNKKWLFLVEEKVLSMPRSSPTAELMQNDVMVGKVYLKGAVDCLISALLELSLESNLYLDLVKNGRN